MSETETNGAPGQGDDLQALLRNGFQLHQAGNLPEAEALYRRVLDVEPDHADAHHLLGMIAHQSGDHETAVDLISKAIRINPGMAAYHSNLGPALKALGRLDDAVESYRQAIALNPDFADAHYNLGNTFKDLERLEDAVDSFGKALAIRPDWAAVLSNLGIALKGLGRLEEAVERYQQAVEINPGHAEAWTNLGNAFQDIGRPKDAIASHQRALTLRPDFAEAHGNLGNAYMDHGETDAAIPCYQTALAIDPDSPVLLSNLGAALHKLGKLEDADHSFRKAIAIDPDYAIAHCKLGIVLTDQRKLDEALACYQKTLALMADHPQAAKLYLYTLLYHPDVTNEDLFEAFRQYTQDRRPDQAAPVLAVPLAAGQRLRIGYMSSDFRNHPLGRNILPLLSHHDHDRFEIFCYAELPGEEDDVTAQFRRDADHWRTINGIPDAEVAEKIRDDGIHIMVYPGGHFDKNRPSVAFHRPAPVQVGIFSGTTSAMDEMDYWLTDAVLNPDDGSEQFSEQLIRLASLFTYPKPEHAPLVSPQPAEDNGFVTFCSFNKPCKMNDAVLDLWSKVLLAVPDARLMLKFKNHFENPTLSRDMLDRFETNGIPAARISLISVLDNLPDHLAHYHNADIALDTFPFAGATTTFQALWMGVPVISLMGERFIGRMGGSLSTHAGLADLVCETPQDYVDTAAALAGDLPRLRELRATLRRRVGASPLCDGPGFAANVEEAYLSMWEAAKATADKP